MPAERSPRVFGLRMNATRANAPIELWFDFASGYAYFAALDIEALAERHGRSVLWRPLTLGAAFKVTGVSRAQSGSDLLGLSFSAS